MLPPADEYLGSNVVSPVSIPVSLSKLYLVAIVLNMVNGWGVADSADLALKNSQSIIDSNHVLEFAKVPDHERLAVKAQSAVVLLVVPLRLNML